MLTSGHVPVRDKVDLVLFNASGQTRAAMTGTNTWVVEAGGGPLGGAPQLLLARGSIGLGELPGDDASDLQP